jgi:hypothetical protein
MQNKMIAFFLSLCILCSPIKQPYDVYIFAGQSNAQGAIGVPAAQTTSAKIIKLTPAGWVTAQEPTNIYYQQPVSTWGYSPATPFALHLLSRNPRARIAIINCAMGGTSISQWKKGGDLYEKFLSLAKSQHVGEIRGIIFIQGESDTATPETAAAWEMKFIQFAKSIRADLGIKNLPIILPLLGTIPPWNSHLGWYTLRDIQIAMPTKIKNVSTVETIDLEKPDGYHYDRAGVEILAQRMADAVQDYQKKTAERISPLLDRKAKISKTIRRK